MDNSLIVNLNGTDIKIFVMDIIEKPEENKKYIIYSIEGNDDNIYASILDEKEDGYTLKYIEDKEEVDKLQKYIESLPDVEESEAL